MQYKEIVSVTGLTGLYQLLTTKSDGAIVRNIGDKTTKFISARQHNVTPLESIEVYTTSENVRLHNVFQKMQEHEQTIPLINPSASKDAVSGYFKSVFPEFDEERVYVSDMKKMLKWYELLKSNELLNFDAQVAEDNAATEEAAAPAATEEKSGEDAPETEEKPAKKAAAKKKASTDEAAAEGEEKPAKKAAAKKKKTEE